MMSKIIFKNNWLPLETKSQMLSSKHRAISDVIVTLMLLSITVIGGVMIFTVFQGAEITENAGSLSGASREETNPSIKIVGHDTRDGTKLMNITNLDNNDDGNLDKGSDMIALQIRNTGTQEFTVERVSINEIVHTWDSSGSGAIGNSQPSAGTFKIIERDSQQIRSSPTLFPGSEFRLILKLSNDFTSDIELNQELRVVVFPSQGKEIFQVIPSGSVG